MKFLTCFLFVIPSVAVFHESGLTFFDPKKRPKDAGVVMQQLNGMVASSQQKLALAERHHRKLVKKTRKEASAMLDDEAKIYGAALNRFSSERMQAEDELQSAIAVGKAGLAQAEAAPSTKNDWRDPEVAQRAKLGAQLASADRILKKSQRRRARQVREGEETAEETLEENAQKLGLKLGDMTPVVDDAKKTLEAAAEKNVDTPKKSVSKPPAAKKVNLDSLQKGLEQASAKSQTETTAANKKLDGFLAKQGKEVEAKTGKIQQDLQAKQQEEISKVLGHKADDKPKSTMTKRAKSPKAATVALAKAAKAPEAKTAKAPEAKMTKPFGAKIAKAADAKTAKAPEAKKVETKTAKAAVANTAKAPEAKKVKK